MRLEKMRNGESLTSACYHDVKRLVPDYGSIYENMSGRYNIQEGRRTISQLNQVFQQSRILVAVNLHRSAGLLRGQRIIYDRIHKLVHRVHHLFEVVVPEVEQRPVVIPTASCSRKSLGFHESICKYVGRVQCIGRCVRNG